LLHLDLLIAIGPLAVKRLDLACKGPGQSIERALGEVLLR
jgi:hypothetical protein